MKASSFFVILSVCISITTIAWGQENRRLAPVELAKYAGPDRERLLYEGAKREGKLVWYTSLVPSKEIAKLFESKYPGVSVEVYRASGMELLNKASAEAQAKRYIADAIESTPGSLMTLRDQQFFIPYYSPHLKNYPQRAKEKGPGGLVFWTTDRESYIGVAFNKNAIRSPDIPKKFDDLLKPGLKGKLAASNDESSARQIGAMIRAKGEIFVRKLKDQEVTLQAETGPGFNELIVTGEVPISFSGFSTNVSHSAAKGAPVAWIPMELNVANAGGVGVSAHAPHPSAAMLLADFLIGPGGQKVLTEQFAYGSAAKEYGFEKWYPESGLSTAEYIDKTENWMKILRQIGHK